MGRSPFFAIESMYEGMCLHTYRYTYYCNTKPRKHTLFGIDARTGWQNLKRGRSWFHFLHFTIFERNGWQYLKKRVELNAGSNFRKSGEKWLTIPQDREEQVPFFAFYNFQEKRLAIRDARNGCHYEVQWGREQHYANSWASALYNFREKRRTIPRKRAELRSWF